jgi:hypothetical protein
MDANNCGSCGVACHPLDQCGQYEDGGLCTLVCEEAFDPSVHYGGVFDIDPQPPSTTCPFSPGYSISMAQFSVRSGDLWVRASPYMLLQTPKPGTADFVVEGLSGCNYVTLTGRFRNADVFEGTWVATVLSDCTGCLTETLSITGTRRGGGP